jgi:hypothetical protein
MTRSVRLGLLLAMLLAVDPRGLLSQSPAASSSAARALHSSPNGPNVGSLSSNAQTPRGETRDGWAQITLEGWIWERSLQKTARADYPLIVAERAGENLRAEPSGAIVAHLEPRTLLQELERKPGWIRVRRQAWVRDDPAAAAPTVAAASPAAAPRSAGAASLPPASGTAARGGGPRPSPLAPPRTAASPSARTEPAPADTSTGSIGEKLAAVPPARIAADPQAFIGRLVRWELQFISLERAEAIRTDFAEGEPFLLTRSVAGERTFVYVAVPADQLDQVKNLLPLERVTVTGRIRVGAAALTGRPIVDLVTIERTRGGGEG